MTIYEKMVEASDLDHSIDMPQVFWVGSFLKAISRRKENAAGLLGDLCSNLLADWAWVDESILSTRLQLVDIEAQDMSHFP